MLLDEPQWEHASAVVGRLATKRGVQISEARARVTATDHGHMHWLQ